MNTKAWNEMFEQVRIAPSILSADFLNLGKDLKVVEKAADWIHVDVMDGHFVPNITMGIPIAKQIREATDMPIDAHLMVSNPLKQIPWFIECGVDYISFHIEAVEDNEAYAAIDMIKAAGVGAACAIKPSTPIDRIKPFIKHLDMVLVMSVEPGFSGQSFIEGCDLRIAEVVSTAEKEGVSPLIQVDGGIGVDTASVVAKAGADVLVCGNAFFKNGDPCEAAQAIRRAALL